MPNKKVTKKVTISFKDYFEEEYEFLNQQHNRSLFICELIRAYMDGEDLSNVRCSTVKQKPVKEETNKNEEEQKTEQGTEQETEKEETEKEGKPKKSRKISGVVRR